MKVCCKAGEKLHRSCYISDRARGITFLVMEAELLPKPADRLDIYWSSTASGVLDHFEAFTDNNAVFTDLQISRIFLIPDNACATSPDGVLNFRALIAKCVLI